MRIILLKMPAKEAEAVRAELTDTTKGAKPESIEAVLKRKGVTEIAGFTEPNPWRNDPVVLKKVTGKLGLNAPERDLYISLTIDGEKSGSGVEGALTSFIELPVTAKKSWVSYSSSGRRANFRLGRWQESAAWEDSRETLTLWSFASRDDAPAPAPSKKSAETLRVEMRLLKAVASDLAQMAKAQPDTREKAALWLSGRAPLWKASVLRAKPDDKVSWDSSEWKLHLEDDQDVADGDSLYFEGGLTGEGEALKMDWKVSIRKMRASGEIVRQISTGVVPGKWDFAIIEGVADTNVLVYRLLRD